MPPPPPDDDDDDDDDDGYGESFDSDSGDHRTHFDDGNDSDGEVPPPPPADADANAEPTHAGVLSAVAMSGKHSSIGGVSDDTHRLAMTGSFAASSGYGSDAFEVDDDNVDEAIRPGLPASSMLTAAASSPVLNASMMSAPGASPPAGVVEVSGSVGQVASESTSSQRYTDASDDFELDNSDEPTSLSSGGMSGHSASFNRGGSDGSSVGAGAGAGAGASSGTRAYAGSPDAHSIDSSGEHGPMATPGQRPSSWSLSGESSAGSIPFVTPLPPHGSTQGPRSAASDYMSDRVSEMTFGDSPTAASASGAGRVGRSSRFGRSVSAQSIEEVAEEEFGSVSGGALSPLGEQEATVEELALGSLEETLDA